MNVWVLNCFYTVQETLNTLDNKSYLSSLLSQTVDKDKLKLYKKFSAQSKERSCRINNMKSGKKTMRFYCNFLVTIRTGIFSVIIFLLRSFFWLFPRQNHKVETCYMCKKDNKYLHVFSFHIKSIFLSGIDSEN